MPSTKPEVSQLFLDALDAPSKTIQNGLFNCLNSYQQFMHFTHIKMNEHLRETVMELFQNTIAANSDNINYKHQINELFDRGTRAIVERYV